MKYSEHLAENRRLALLKLLVESGGSANEGLIYRGIQALGFAKATPELVRADLDWLRERGLVTHEWFDDRVLVATITSRGVNVAEGKETVDGVAAPRIGA